MVRNRAGRTAPRLLQESRQLGNVPLDQGLVGRRRGDVRADRPDLTLRRDRHASEPARAAGAVWTQCRQDAFRALLPTLIASYTQPVLEPTQSREAHRAGRRQRMFAAVGALAVVLLAAIVVVAVAQGGGSRLPRKYPAVTAHRTVKPRAVHATVSEQSTASLEAQGEATIQRLAKLGLPIYCGGPHGNAVAFTFDDGPGPYTHYAVKKLTQAHQRATFFVVGRSMTNFPGWLPRELKIAAIGDHTTTHPVLPALSPPEIASEIVTTKQRIEVTTGQKVYLFRPPYGALNATVLQTARQLGLAPILWTVDSGDSLGANWAGIIGNVEAGLHPGAIILMHENRGQTIRALTTLLPELQHRHLRSVSLPELFASDPPSVAQVRRGQLGCGHSVKTSTASG